MPDESTGICSSAHLNHVILQNERTEVTKYISTPKRALLCCCFKGTNWLQKDTHREVKTLCILSQQTQQLKSKKPNSLISCLWGRCVLSRVQNDNLPITGLRSGNVLDICALSTLKQGSTMGKLPTAFGCQQPDAVWCVREGGFSCKGWRHAKGA